VVGTTETGEIGLVWWAWDDEALDAGGEMRWRRGRWMG
jgi:hypothetical protein